MTGLVRTGGIALVLFAATQAADAPARQAPLAPPPLAPLALPAPLSEGPRDPALRMGTLPNGLRYYVRANAMPAGRAELRLVVNAGSMQEDADQQGMAHFLEHMAFNGTRNFPAQQLIEFVETSGMRFGADLNAYTSFDETVYMLTVPTDERRFLEQGLTILHDWASGGILIDSAEVVAERGVVLGEWRSRLPDTLSQKVQKHQREVLFGPGSRYLDRLPIGEPALLETAERGPLARFYRDWYRPDLVAVVVVGDIDAAAVEREIVQRFGGIPAAKKAPPRVPSTVPVSPESVVDVHRAPLTPSVQVLWPVPPLPTEPRDVVRRQLVEQLLLESLEQRFLRMRELPSRPFVIAGMQRGTVVRPLEVVGFQLIAWPDSLERGVAAVLSEIERIAQHGIPASALNRRKTALLRQLEHAAAGAATRSSKAFADEYAQHYLTGEGLLVSPAQELELAREVLPGITPDVVAGAAGFWRDEKGRKVMVSLYEYAHVRPPTRESMLAIFDSVAGTRFESRESQAVAESPLLESPPAPGRIVGERRHEAAGVTEWRLSNGARVLFKPSANHPDELLLKAWSPGGFSRVPDTLFFTPGRMVARMMTEAAGLGRHDRDELAAQLAVSGVRDFRVEIGYGDESISLEGSPKEAELLFQMLHLQFTAPKLDTAALAGWKNYAKYYGRQITIFNQLDQVFARGNPRLLPVSTHLAELASLDEAMAVYRDRFGNAGDFTFTIVGAAAPDQVRAFVERYIASLPATEERETPKDPEVRPFLNQIKNTARIFDIPKASTLLVFDGEFPTEPNEYLAEQQRLATLVGVLNRRLRERMREQLGATYGVAVVHRTYPLPGEHYQVLLQFDAAPERVRELHGELTAILDSVRSYGASEAELEQMRTIQRRLLETQLQSNDYWMNRIGLFARLGIPFDRIVSPYPEASVAPAELRAAAQRYIPRDVFIQMTAMPKDTTLYMKDGSGEPPSQIGTKRE